MTITGITTRVARTEASLGLTKRNLRGVRDPREWVAAAEYEANADGLVAVQEEVGLHDGSEAGSLVARAFALEAGTIPAANIQTVSGSTGTIAAATALARVTYAVGTCALDVSALPVGGRVVIAKGNTSAYGITVVGDGNDAINGGSAGVLMTLPGSTTACSSTAADPSWTVYRDSSTVIRVIGGGGDASVSTTSDPSTTDDSSAGRTVGQRWINTSAGRTWECRDATTSSALWARVGGPPSTLTANAGTVALYRFEGGLTDSSGNGYDLTSAGTWVYPYGFGGRRSAFTSGGTGNNASAALKLVSNLTVELLIKPTYTGSTQTILVNGSTKRRYYVDVNPVALGLQINFGYEWSGGVDAIEVYTPYQEWCHLVFNRSISGGNTTLNGYVNGHLAMTETNAHTPDNTDAAVTMYLGRSNGGSATLTTCSLAGMHLSTTVWTAAQVKQRTQLVLPSPGWGS